MCRARLCVGAIREQPIPRRSRTLPPHNIQVSRSSHRAAHVGLNRNSLFNEDRDALSVPAENPRQGLHISNTQSGYWVDRASSQRQRLSCVNARAQSGDDEFLCSCVCGYPPGMTPLLATPTHNRARHIYAGRVVVPAGYAGPESSCRSACPCDRPRSTPAHLTEPGSSPRQSLDHASQRRPVDRPIHDDPIAVDLSLIHI